MKKVSFFQKYKYYFLLVIILISIIYLGQKLTATTSTNENNFTIDKVSKGSVTASITATGKVETANFLPVTTSVNGIVKNIFVKEGQTVSKGQKLMEIKLNADGEQNINQARASLISAQNSLFKAKNDLISKETTYVKAQDAFKKIKETTSFRTSDDRFSYKVAENDYINSKNDYKNQINVIEQAQANLDKEYLSYQSQQEFIIAPDSGVIANILFVEGMEIKNSLTDRSSVNVASIKQEGTPIVSLTISEMDINKVSVGLHTFVSLAAIPDKKFEGKVVGIDRIGSISNNMAQYTVIIKLNDSSSELLPNMRSEGQIIISQKDNVLLVPNAAINKSNSGPYVLNSSNQKINVVLGIQGTDYTEVVSGLNEGDQILIQSLPTTGFVNTTTNGSNTRSPQIFGNSGAGPLGR
jgi:HlyD family secretion protein